MPHQNHALAWMYWCETQKSKDVLANYVGLGKTPSMSTIAIEVKPKMMRVPNAKKIMIKWINKSAGGQQRLNTIVSTLMLRRTKTRLQQLDQLSNLPQKRIELIEADLNSEEMNVYQKFMIYTRGLMYQRAEHNVDLIYAGQNFAQTFMTIKN
uniref:SNF2 N-terminal domain-containing protein n=1 Tax=Glossina brevipalpis TaxID=37001 RepID=A0A1A9W7I0_9MUSC